MSRDKHAVKSPPSGGAQLTLAPLGKNTKVVENALSLLLTSACSIAMFVEVDLCLHSLLVNGELNDKIKNPTNCLLIVHINAYFFGCLLFV